MSIKKLKIKIPKIKKIYEDRFERITKTKSHDYEKKLSIINCQALLAVEVVKLIQKGMSAYSACEQLSISIKQQKELYFLIGDYMTFRKPKQNPEYTVLKIKIKELVAKGKYCHENVGTFSGRLHRDIGFRKTEYNFGIISEELKKGKSIADISANLDVDKSVIIRVKEELTSQIV